MSNLSDPIADFLARLRNAAQAHRGDVSVPYSRMKEEIARILKQEYISLSSRSTRRASLPKSK